MRARRHVSGRGRISARGISGRIASRFEPLESRFLMSGGFTSTFRTDTGLDLDLYQPCSGGDNAIDFDINVSGVDPASIREARLTLSVFDVDFNGGGVPERDTVSLNGHPLTSPTGYLTGANDQWSTVTFDVEKDWIVEGANKVHIAIDVLGGGWCVTCDWGELNVEAQEVRVDQLSAFEDTNLSQNSGALGDVVWDVNGTNHPIADAATGGGAPGRMKLKARVGVDTGTFPDEDLKVKYEWEIPGTGKKGTSEFTVNAAKQDGEVTVSMPPTVGAYNLVSKVTITDKDGNQVNQQNITQPLYVTLNSSLVPNPDVDWVKRATGWASGASNAEQAVQRVMDGVYGAGWQYRDTVDGDRWRQLVEGLSTQGNCVSFSNVWSNMSRVLGVSTGVQQTNGPTGAFVTKAGSVSADGLTGNAHRPGAASDRWVFGMHQVGKFGGRYYDPTFRKTWTGSIDSFIEWGITGEGTDAGGAIFYKAGGNRFYVTGLDPVGWDYEYAPEPAPAPSPSPSPSPFRLQSADDAQALALVSASSPSFAAAAGSLAFTDAWAPRAVDADGDGIFDALALDLTLEATAAGDYNVAGFLEAGGALVTNRASANSSMPFTVPVRAAAAGPVSATVLFSGEDIFRSGLDGPYTATLMIGGAAGVSDGRTLQVSGFTHGQFGEIPLSLVGAADRGSDADGDGRFDDLVVAVTAGVRAPASGYLSGVLYTATGELIAETSVPVSLAAGTATVPLTFDGTQILRSGANGPYRFEAAFYDDNFVQLGSVAADTAAYGYLDFEAAGQLGTYADRGVDANGNGKFDLLVVDAQVAVTTPGEYTIEAALYDANGTEVEAVIRTATLGAGPNAFRLEFDGAGIFRNRVNGPYFVRYVALRDNEYLDYVEDAFATKAYAYTQFESPAVRPVALTGLYTDAGVDTDGDGKFDFLDVDVEVLAQLSGTHDLNARLMDADGNEIGWAATSVFLTAGQPRAVRLRYNGRDIGAHGVNGPFILQDVYVYNRSNVSRSDSAYRPYTTAAYGANQFEGYVARNLPPVITPIPDQVVDEGSLLTFTATATDPDRGQVLTYSLCNCGPAGATIDSVTGVFAWLAGDGTDSSSFEKRVIVTDNGTPSLESIELFRITVRNVAPSASVAGPSSGVRGQPRMFTLGAADPSQADREAGFTYHIDWDGDGTADETVSGPDGTRITHVFPDAGQYTVRVTAVDKDGGVSTEAAQGVKVGAIAYQPDPTDPTKTALVVGGTTGDDTIAVNPGGGRNAITVLLNGQSVVLGPPTGRLIIFGQEGNDKVHVAGGLVVPVLAYGGAGADWMKGGDGLNVLVGGDGDDTLTGGLLRDLLIGGAGADALNGGPGDDVIVAGPSDFDFGRDADLLSVLDEWSAAERDYGTRVANLSGTGSGRRLNGNVFLVAENADEEKVTVFDDMSSDVLTGASGRDWFLADSDRDRVADAGAGEVLS